MQAHGFGSSSISAAAMLVLVYKNATSDEAKPNTNRLTVAIHGQELGQESKPWALPITLFSKDEFDMSSGDLDTMASNIALVVSSHCDGLDDYPDAEVVFSPERFKTNVTVVKSTSKGKGIFGTKIMRTEITQSRRKTTLVPIASRDVEYPTNDVFTIFFWQTKNGKRVAVRRLEDAIADFKNQKEFLILQLSSPGYRSTLVMFSPATPLKQPLNLERRLPRVVLDYDDSLKELAKNLQARLELNSDIQVMDKTDFQQLRAEYATEYPVRNDGELKSIQEKLRLLEVDCIATLFLSKPAK